MVYKTSEQMNIKSFIHYTFIHSSKWKKSDISFVFGVTQISVLKAIGPLKSKGHFFSSQIEGEWYIFYKAAVFLVFKSRISSW